MTLRYRATHICQMTFAAAFLVVALAGCSGSRTAPPQVDARGAAPSVAQMPEGAGCSGAIARYSAVMDNDHATHHVNQSVYDQIQSEISEAASACSSGQDARAMSLIRASKARHGYPG